MTTTQEAATTAVSADMVRMVDAGTLISIVVPVFNEEESVLAFIKVVGPILEGTGANWELVFVDDGSSDRTVDILLAQRTTVPQIKIVKLSRNFGKEAALAAGLDFASGDMVAVMDVDMQDPPELLAQMIARWREGYDIAYGRRVQRDSDGFLKRLTAGRFYKLFNSISDAPIPDNVGDFRLMDRSVVDALNKLPERVRFMKGLFAWVGFKSIAVDYERPARLAGQTKFRYWRLWNFALDGITSFSTVPLRIWTYVGLLIALVSFVYGSYIIMRTVIFGVDVPGYASLLVLILFLGGVQLMGLGIIGEYLGRVFYEVKQRPLYLAEKLYGFERD
ncbi:bactoprenol glucosyl transferase [Hyphomonas sp. GM-8P]|nr:MULTISPECIES: glycosyltransferase family 2 protein [unclassified Hyphomonas]RAN37157.1 bactoprenol glucosyl transferase [Hyphomonas sp. GM-8P]